MIKNINKFFKEWGPIITFISFIIAIISFSWGFVSQYNNLKLEKQNQNIYIENAQKELEDNILKANSIISYQNVIKSGDSPLFILNYQNLEKLTAFYPDVNIRQNIIDYTTGIAAFNRLINMLSTPFDYNSQESLIVRTNQVKTLVDFANSTKENSILLKNKLLPIKD